MTITGTGDADNKGVTHEHFKTVFEAQGDSMNMESDNYYIPFEREIEMILIETILFICIFVCVVFLAKYIHMKICCTKTAKASVRSKKKVNWYTDNSVQVINEYVMSYPDESGKRHVIKVARSPFKIVHYNPKNPSEAYGDEQKLVSTIISLGILIVLFTVPLFLLLTGK